MSGNVRSHLDRVFGHSHQFLHHHRDSPWHVKVTSIGASGSGSRGHKWSSKIAIPARIPNLKKGLWLPLSAQLYFLLALIDPELVVVRCLGCQAPGTEVLIRGISIAKRTTATEVPMIHTTSLSL